MSMTGKWIWGIVVLIVIAAALWYSGIFGGTSSQQAAVVTGNNTPPTSNSSDPALADAALDIDAANIDATIKMINESITAAGTAPTKAQLVTVSTRITALGKQFATVATKLESRMINAKTAGTPATDARAALMDLSTQSSNMTAQASTASMATSTSGTMTKRSVEQIKAAQGYMVAARAALQKAFTSLGVK